MYSVKFYSYFDDGSHVCHAIGCPHYSIYKSEKYARVMTYQDFTDTKGVERIVGIMTDEGEPRFESCYIENEKGKTVDSISFTSGPL